MLNITPCVATIATAVALLCSAPLPAFGQSTGQTTISWNTLAKVNFDYRWDSNAQMEVSVPDFHETVKALDGSEVAISGYMIPVDVESGYYVISAFPFAACFFCGGAGPESVVDLHLKKKESFKTDERLTVCGVLSLNQTDIYQLPYQLLNARPCNLSREN